MTAIVYCYRRWTVHDDTCAWTLRRDPIQIAQDSSKWVGRTSRNELRSGRLAPVLSAIDNSSCPINGDLEVSGPIGRRRRQ